MRPARRVVAVALLGTLGGARASSVTGAGAAETRAAEATAIKMDVFMVGQVLVTERGVWVCMRDASPCLVFFFTCSYMTSLPFLYTHPLSYLFGHSHTCSLPLNTNDMHHAHFVSPNPHIHQAYNRHHCAHDPPNQAGQETSQVCGTPVHPPT